MPKITVFSTATCVFCRMLKEYLTKNSFAYEEVLIDKYPEQAQTSFAVCGSMGVPCTQIELDDGREESVLGFDKAKFDHLLGLT